MDVVRRRVIRCTGPKVLDIEDDLLDVDAAGGRPTAVTVVGDGALLATLARAKSDRMRDIVATIQREQDQAIRAPAGGVTLIEGGPGTGKTAVALHRAAHLLYRDRRRYEGGRRPAGRPVADLHVLCGACAAVARRGHGRASLARRRRRRRDQRPARPAAPGRAEGLAADAPVPAAGRPRGPAGRPDRASHCLRRQVLRVRAADLVRVRGQLHQKVQHPNAGGPEARRGAASTALWADRPEDVTWSTRRSPSEIYDRDEFERFARAWWPMLARLEVLGWLARPRTASGDAGRDWLSQPRTPTRWPSPGRARRRTSRWPTSRCVDELRALLGEPPRPPRRGPAAASASTSPATTFASCPL